MYTRIVIDSRYANLIFLCLDTYQVVYDWSIDYPNGSVVSGGVQGLNISSATITLPERYLMLVYERLILVLKKVKRNASD